MISEPKLSKFEDKKQVLHFKKVIVKYTYIYIYTTDILFKDIIDIIQRKLNLTVKVKAWLIY